jgi:hypothetical protein
MQDRIRWAQYAEAMASAHNLYAVSRQKWKYFLPSIFYCIMIDGHIDLLAINTQTPMPPPYFYQTPSTLQSNPAPSLVHPTLPPPPIPPRNKVPVRQSASLPVGLVTSTASQMISNLQELARKISRKKKSAPRVSRSPGIRPLWRLTQN